MATSEIGKSIKNTARVGKPISYDNFKIVKCHDNIPFHDIQKKLNGGLPYAF